MPAQLLQVLAKQKHVLVYCTRRISKIKGRQSGKHLLCEWPIALIIYMYSHQGQIFVGDYS